MPAGLPACGRQRGEKKINNKKYQS